MQPAERDVERRRARRSSGSVDRDRARQLAEQARPGVAAGDRLLGEELLLGLGEQVRAVAAHRAQVVAHGVEAVGGQQLVGALVVERGPLELEEQQLRLDRGGALLHAREQRAVGGVGGVDREAQRARRSRRARRARRSPRARAIAAARPGPSSSATRAGVVCGEAGGALVGLVEQAVGALRAVAVDERLEVPGDVLQVGGGVVIARTIRPGNDEETRQRRGDRATKSDAVPSRSGCSPPRRLPEERRGLRAAGLATPGPRSLRTRFRVFGRTYAWGRGHVKGARTRFPLRANNRSARAARMAAGRRRCLRRAQRRPRACVGTSATAGR